MVETRARRARGSTIIERIHCNSTFYPERNKNGSTKANIILFSISRRFQLFPDYFRWFRKISENYRRFSETADDFWRLPKMSGDFRKCTKTTKVSQDYRRFPKRNPKIFDYIFVVIFTCERYICYLPAGRFVYWKTVTEILKMLPEAAGRGQRFQGRGHSFSLYGPTLSR